MRPEYLAAPVAVAAQDATGARRDGYHRSFRTSCRHPVNLSMTPPGPSWSHASASVPPTFASTPMPGRPSPREPSAHRPTRSGPMWYSAKASWRPPHSQGGNCWRTSWRTRFSSATRRDHRRRITLTRLTNRPQKRRHAASRRDKRCHWHCPRPGLGGRKRPPTTMTVPKRSPKPKLSLLDPGIESSLISDDEIYEPVREPKPEEAAYWAKQADEWLDKPIEISSEAK